MSVPQLDNRQPVDQLKKTPSCGRLPTCRDVPDHLATALIAARPDLFARQGSVSTTWRRRNGSAYGPYYRLSYRDDGRQCSIYLGRDGPIVAHVRRMLDALQKPLRQKRLYDRIEREARSALRANNARLAILLRPYGLRLKGFEIRGWRTTPLRPWLPRCSRLITSLPHSPVFAAPNRIRPGIRSSGLAVLVLGVAEPHGTV